MRSSILAVLLAALCTQGFSQTVVQEIDKTINPETGLEPLHFLASDKLMGRSPKRPEIQVAANYIADQFKTFGLQKIHGQTDYFQSFELKSVTAAKNGSLAVNGHNFSIGNELVQLGGADISLQAPIVFAGFGTEADFNKADVKGKIVFTYFGLSDSSTLRDGFAVRKMKASLLAKKGALALVEILKQKGIAWEPIQEHFGSERTVVADDPIPVFLLNAGDAASSLNLRDGDEATISISGNIVKSIPAKNVMGLVPGTDPKLKSQYIVLSAHYDHIGVASSPQDVDGKKDSIYNGARDNAIGVTAVVNAARYFAKHPAKRSLLFVLFTAEEMGLLGSRYFADHPVLPLNEIVYNLNCDNGGYNDTTIVTVIGLGRTSADDDIKKAALAYHVKAIADPVPELNLFDRSDNLNLAVKGIPAPTFGMGVTSFDSVIRKYYHQLSDEVNSFNLRYALTYIKAYVLAAKNIADNPAQPVWVKNDKYEAAWKELYGEKKQK